MNSFKRLLQLACLTLTLMSWSVAMGQEGKKPAPKIEPTPIATQSQQALEKITKDKRATRSDKLEAYALLAARAQAAKEDKKAQDYAKRALKIWSVLERDKTKSHQRDCDSAARAAFTQAELERRHLEELPLSPKDLNKDLKLKIGVMTQAQSSYLKVLSLGRQCGLTMWVAASMERTGELFEDFAQTLEHSPSPKNLVGQESEEIYRASLREFSAPMLQKAQESYQSAQEVEAKGDAATIDWQKRAQDRQQGVQAQLCELTPATCPASGATSH